MTRWTAALARYSGRDRIFLAAYSNDDALLAMIEDLPAMDDFGEFVKSHGVNLPNYDRKASAVDCGALFGGILPMSVQ